MKKIHLVLLMLMAGFFVACSESASTESTGEGEGTETAATENKAEAAEAVAYNIDTEGAKVMFLGSKDEGVHTGSMVLSAGNFELDDKGFTAGSATLDLTGMAILDEELDEETKGKLAGHLSSEDFFDVANHPSISISITGSEAYTGEGETAPEGLAGPMADHFVADPTHNVMAKLTVKGEEGDITFPAKVVANEDGTVTTMAFVTFDRRDYGLRFMSDTESTVHPEVHVAMNFSAGKAAM